MNYETMQHLNRERLDRRRHEATNERLAHAGNRSAAADGWSWLAAARTRLLRPVAHAARNGAPQPQL
jgi:hypothetical protein